MFGWARSRVPPTPIWCNTTEAMRKLQSSPRSILGTSLVGAGLCLVFAACSAGGEDSAVLPVQPGQAGAGSPGGAPGVAGATPGVPDREPGFNLVDGSGGTEAPKGCQQAQREFVPQIPAVFVLVDRSGTMFDSIPNEAGPAVTPWSALRGGVLEVMQELQANVRFGFGAFSGQNLGAQMCRLDAPGVAPSLDNYDAIAALYEPLEKPADSKETPTTLALANAAQQLRDDPTDGDRYILFVTDGEPDYCDDGNNLCPPDSVVGLLQELAAGVDPEGNSAPPIQTLVFGIASPTATIQQSALQSFANAGAGLPVAPFSVNPNPGDPNFIDTTYDQCSGVLGWAADFARTGKTAARGQTVGTYAADPALAGSAPVFRPDPLDQAALTDQIRTALAAVKSCTFDLGEDGVQVDLSREDLGDLARIVVNGNPVPFDADNGWSMLSETTVELGGEACAAWRSPTIETSISFDFPCDIFVPR